MEINDRKATWIGAVDDLVRLSKGGKFSKDVLADASDHADAVFSALEDFAAAESRLWAARTARQNRESQLAFILVPVLSAAVMIFLSYWGWRQIYSASEQFHDALTAADEATATAEEARRRAEKASLAKDNFLGTVSHELRNPLNSIMLWSSALLAKSDLDANLRRGLAAIERSAKAQAQLIEDLLDVSRIQSGRLRLDVQMVDLAEVVRAGVESIRAGAEAKSIVLQEIIDPRVDFIAGDPGRLQQVVWNQVSKAVKFTPKGGQDSSPGRAHKFTCRDRGRRPRRRYRACLARVSVRPILASGRPAPQWPRCRPGPVDSQKDSQSARRRRSGA